MLITARILKQAAANEMENLRKAFEQQGATHEGSVKLSWKINQAMDLLAKTTKIPKSKDSGGSESYDQMFYNICTTLNIPSQEWDDIAQSVITDRLLSGSKFSQWLDTNRDDFRGGIRQALKHSVIDWMRTNQRQTTLKDEAGDRKNILYQDLANYAEKTPDPSQSVNPDEGMIVARLKAYLKERESALGTHVKEMPVALAGIFNGMTVADLVRLKVKEQGMEVPDSKSKGWTKFMLSNPEVYKLNRSYTHTYEKLMKMITQFFKSNPAYAKEYPWIQKQISSLV